MQSCNCRALGAFGGADIVWRRARTQIGGGLQFITEIEVSVNAFQIIVEMAALGDYLIDQKSPLIQRTVKLRNLCQMAEEFVLGAGQSVSDREAKGIGD